MNTSGISPSFLGLSRSSGQVTHVLLTRSRLCPRASPGSSLHLHVLSTPPAFVLSQDQTLRERRACHPMPKHWFHYRVKSGGVKPPRGKLSCPYCLTRLRTPAASLGLDGFILRPSQECANAPSATG